MRKICRGMFARSLAGHDAGRLYMIWDASGEFLYLTDGKTRTISRPKKKNKKHTQVDYRIAPEMEASLSAGTTFRDEDVRTAIRSRDKGGIA